MNLPLPPPDYEARMPRFEEALLLSEIGLDAFGRTAYLTPEAGQAWQAMQWAAGQDGVQLLLLSSFRSLARQAEILSRKLAGGAELAEILCVNTYPGFSEHHTGRAIDVGSSSCEHLTEAFEQTPEYAWLERRAVEFGFFQSYPRDNVSGIVFEPWHWCFEPSRTLRRPA